MHQPTRRTLIALTAGAAALAAGCGGDGPAPELNTLPGRVATIA